LGSWAFFFDAWRWNVNGEKALAACLREFHTLATCVWAEYQDVGPGRVDAALFDDGKAAAARVLELLGDDNISATMTAAELRAAVEKVCDLATRCATRPEGLCFITGEAGLVPRRDWHAAMEESLTVIGEAVAALS
jgi:hypothetical protein